MSTTSTVEVLASLRSLFINATSSSLTVKANQGNRTGMDATQSLQRFWTLTETGDLTSDLKFNYRLADVMGTESNYGLFRFVTTTGAAVTPFTLSMAAHTISTNGISAFSDWTVGNLTPLAAEVSVSGRVVAVSGRGVANGRLTFTNSQGAALTTWTSPTGRFSMEGLEPSESYIVTISAKGFRFAPQLLTLSQDLTGVVFTATP